MEVNTSELIQDYGSGSRTNRKLTDVGLVDTDPRCGFQQQLRFPGQILPSTSAFMKQVLEVDQDIECLFYLKR